MFPPRSLITSKQPKYAMFVPSQHSTNKMTFLMYFGLDLMLNSCFLKSSQADEDGGGWEAAWREGVLVPSGFLVVLVFIVDSWVSFILLLFSWFSKSIPFKIEVILRLDSSWAGDELMLISCFSTFSNLLLRPNFFVFFYPVTILDLLSSMFSGILLEKIYSGLFVVILLLLFNGKNAGVESVEIISSSEENFSAFLIAALTLPC